MQPRSGGRGCQSLGAGMGACPLGRGAGMLAALCEPRKNGRAGSMPAPRRPSSRELGENLAFRGTNCDSRFVQMGRSRVRPKGGRKAGADSTSPDWTASPRREAFQAARRPAVALVFFYFSISYTSQKGRFPSSQGLLTLAPPKGTFENRSNPALISYWILYEKPLPRKQTL